MRNFIAALLLTITMPVSADVLSGQDKVLHMGASFAIGTATNQYINDTQDFSSLKGTTVAMGACMVPGVVKEAFDEYHYHGWDNKDLVADAIGCAVGVYVNEFINESYNVTVFHKEDSYGVSVSYKF